MEIRVVIGVSVVIGRTLNDPEAVIVFDWTVPFSVPFLVDLFSEGEVVMSLDGKLVTSVDSSLVLVPVVSLDEDEALPGELCSGPAVKDWVLLVSRVLVADCPHDKLEAPVVSDVIAVPVGRHENSLLPSQESEKGRLVDPPPTIGVGLAERS